MTTAAQRIAHYLEQRRALRWGVDPDVIHNLHLGTPNEASLTVSDLAELLQSVEDRSASVAGYDSIAELNADHAQAWQRVREVAEQKFGLDTEGKSVVEWIVDLIQRAPNPQPTSTSATTKSAPADAPGPLKAGDIVWVDFVGSDEDGRYTGTGEFVSYLTAEQNRNVGDSGEAHCTVKCSADDVGSLFPVSVVTLKPRAGAQV